MGKVVKTTATTNLAPLHAQLPAFMQSAEVQGLDDLSQYIVPPRLKIVQKMSGSPFDELFSVGEVVAVPQLMRIAGLDDAKAGEMFFITPLFFFVEWCTLNPFQMKGSLPFIRERSDDPGSALASKSRSPATWQEPCPENAEYSIRHCEMLNFIVLLLGNTDFSGIPVVMSFSKAEHRSGTNFASLIKMRRAPIYGGQYAVATAERPSAKGNWFGFNIVNPPGDCGVTPFVEDEERFNQLKAIHMELDAAARSSKIRVDYDDTESEAVSSTIDAATEY